jgi:hypothetical protein
MNKVILNSVKNTNGVRNFAAHEVRVAKLLIAILS